MLQFSPIPLFCPQMWSFSGDLHAVSIYMFINCLERLSLLYSAKSVIWCQKAIKIPPTPKLSFRDNLGIRQPNFWIHKCRNRTVHVYTSARNSCRNYLYILRPMEWILDTKLLLCKRELNYKFHYCLISQDMYWPCGTPRSTSGGKQFNRWCIQMYLYKRAVEWYMDTLKSYFWEFHNYQNLQYMCLSLRLNSFVKMNSWLSKFALLLKAGTC